MNLVKNNHSLSIIIFTSNEVNRIAPLIKAYRSFSEIIVCDNYSSDGTVAVAESLGARVVQRSKKGELTKDDIKKAAESASYDWIYFGSCSEVLSLTLVKKIKEVLENKDNKYKGIKVARISYTFGRKTHIVGDKKPNKKNIRLESVRIAKRDSIDWQNSKIHMETPTNANPHEILWIPPDSGAVIFHFRSSHCASVEAKHAAYADTEARYKWKEGARFSWYKLILSPVFHFLVMLLKNPTPVGVIVAMQHAQLIANIHIRLWIKTNDPGSDRVTENPGESWVCAVGDLEQGVD